MASAIKSKMSPVPLKKFSFAKGWWKDLETVNRERAIPAVLKFWKETGRIEAVKLQWKEGMPNQPHIFWDSDVVKWIEGAACSLAKFPDKKLEAEVEEICKLYAKSQSADGYINSYYNTLDPEKRLSNLRDNHELYCAGHLFEAAAALYEATGSRTLLDPALKFVSFLSKTFGKEPGKRRGCCGHEEIELALVRLYRATGEKAALDLAGYFIDERGTEPNSLAPVEGSFSRDWPYSYYQAHKPVREQDEAVGHAVRACYLYSGMIDVAVETGDKALYDACRKLWDSIALRKMYVTGGIGTPWGEAFTYDYDLPNENAYCETCAGISLALFSLRMLNVDLDSKYSDVIERVLLNNVVAGVSMEGDAFFYANVLASNPADRKIPTRTKYQPSRQKGFDCSCCPPNVARTFASLSKFFLSSNESSVCFHLYGSFDSEVQLKGGTLKLSQRSGYPFDGKIVTSVDAASPVKCDLLFRIPAWASKRSVKLNGAPVDSKTLVKGYLKLSREWKSGDKVELVFDMAPVAIEAHPLVRQDAGRVALMRGPLIYCLEEVDNGGNLEGISLDLSKPLKEKSEKSLFGGVPVVEVSGFRSELKGWEGALYRPFGSTKSKKVKVRAVPYQLWANRGEGEMIVWIRKG